ncbi:hypothetical protein D9M70_428950 [compost metagenome]
MLVAEEDVVEGHQQALGDFRGQVEGVVLGVERAVVIAVQHQDGGAAGAGVRCVHSRDGHRLLEQLLRCVVGDDVDAVEVFVEKRVAEALGGDDTDAHLGQGAQRGDAARAIGFVVISGDGELAAVGDVVALYQRGLVVERAVEQVAQADRAGVAPNNAKGLVIERVSQPAGRLAGGVRGTAGAQVRIGEKCVDGHV